MNRFGRRQRTSAPSSSSIADEEEGRGDAVGVVVAVHGDGFAALQRLVDAASWPRRCPAAGKGSWTRWSGRRKALRRGRVVEAAAHEDLGEGLADAELVGEPARGRVVDRRDAPGAVVDHGSITDRVYRARATDAPATNGSAVARRAVGGRLLAAGWSFDVRRSSRQLDGHRLDRLLHGHRLRGDPTVTGSAGVSSVSSGAGAGVSSVWSCAGGSTATTGIGAATRGACASASLSRR